MRWAEHAVCMIYKNAYKTFTGKPGVRRQIFKKYVKREWIWIYLAQNRDCGRLLKTQ
jgi:hypothetical protein